MPTVTRFSAEQADREIGQLTGLLVDAVESGASIGFLPPLGYAEALVGGVGR